MSAAAGGIALPLGITFAVQALVAFAVYCAPVMAPVAGPALGFSAAAVGYYIAATYFGSMIGSAVAGGWVARFGPIRVSQAGLALCLAGLLLAASASPPLVMLGGFVVGLGYGPTTPASSVILVRAAPPGMFALTFSIKQTGVPAGAAITPAGVFSWTPSVAQVGAQSVTVRVTDNGINPRFAEQQVSVTVLADSDLDGVPNVEETGGPNSGDANRDGIPDSQQANVASLKNAIDNQYVTLVSPTGTTLVSVQASPLAPGAPSGVQFPFGQIGFEVHGVTLGGSAQVTVLLPTGSLVNSFYKYGPEPGAPPLNQAHWYDFGLNGGTGATISGNTAVRAGGPLNLTNFGTLNGHAISQ